MPMKLGDALWGTISAMGTYKVYFADPQAGQVGFEGTIRENGTPAILVIRLKVEDRKIAEVETIVRAAAPRPGRGSGKIRPSESRFRYSLSRPRNGRPARTC